MPPMDRPKRLLVRTSLVAGSTVATLIGAQTLMTVDQRDAELKAATEQIQALTVNTDTDDLATQPVLQPTATTATIVHVQPSIQIIHAAPSIVIVRQPGQIAANTSSQTVAAQPTAVPIQAPAQTVIKPPVPVQIAAPDPVVIQQSSSQSSASTTTSVQPPRSRSSR